MINVEASILAADFARLGEQAQEAEVAGVDGIQVDVMDGRFVPNITFGPGVVQALRPLIRVKLEADLMIVKPELHIGAFADAGADRIIVHLEACLHPYRVVQSIRDLGIEAGVAIAPGTPVSAVVELLDAVDLVQVMTVNPGWGGQPFLHDQLRKIDHLRRVLEERNLNIPIGVDGGINLATASAAVGAGATVLVSGSGIYNDNASVAENVASLRAQVALQSPWTQRPGL
ncbi:MAG: ribulose-phosphate 3-epimerase [Deltaproteobacteria bacterium]|nr:ribulose-phosphate 3-epimerase [Deltaproteobacteria bacterium]